MSYEMLNRNVIYSGRVFDVVKRQYRLPDGRVATYDLVEHSGAVTLVPIDPQGNLLFVRQYRVGADLDLLELPAGVLEAGEDPAEGAAREVREETGMAAGELRPLGTFYMAPGYSTELMHVFLATQLFSSPLPADDDEFLKLEKIPVAQALDMARQGQIQDGKSLAALWMAAPYLH